LTEAIRLRSAAHAFEGKVFNIVASCALDAEAIEQLSQGDSKMKELLWATPAPVSIIVGPDGEALGDPVTGGEGIIVADIDIAESIELKMMHDIVGHYNRFDIFHLEVDPTPNQPVSIKKATRREEHPSNGSSQVELQVTAQVTPQVATDEAASSANEWPIAVVRAKAR
jgi:nitrilase/aliphatic nitrilase